MKKIGFSGTDGSIKNSYNKDTDSLLNEIGNNSGNLFFQKAVLESIKEETVNVGRDLKWNIGKIKEQARLLVVPSANFIRENTDFTAFVDFLEKVDMPLVFLGLDVQARDTQQKEFNFHPSVLKLIDLCKERCKIAGVRGDYTKKILNDFGVSNTEVTGCPSNFFNKSPDLRERLTQKWKAPIESFIVVQDEIWPSEQKKKEVERKLVKLSINGSSILIQQSVPPLINYLRRNNTFSNSKVNSNFIKSVKDSIAPDIQLERFKSFVNTRFRVYYNIDQWMEDSANFSLSVGLRLHGNMISWQSGTPSIWIYHDSRTKELCDSMCIPSISLDQFMEADTITQVKEIVDFDLDKYFTRREILYKQYCDILDLNKIIYE